MVWLARFSGWSHKYSGPSSEFCLGSDWMKSKSLLRRPGWVRGGLPCIALHRNRSRNCYLPPCGARRARLARRWLPALGGTLCAPPVGRAPGLLSRPLTWPYSISIASYNVRLGKARRLTRRAGPGWCLASKMKKAHSPGRLSGMRGPKRYFGCCGRVGVSGNDD